MATEVRHHNFLRPKQSGGRERRSKAKRREREEEREEGNKTSSELIRTTASSDCNIIVNLYISS